MVVCEKRKKTTPDKKSFDRYMKEPLLFLACHSNDIPLLCKYFLVYDINCLLFFKKKQQQRITIKKKKYLLGKRASLLIAFQHVY